MKQTNVPILIALVLLLELGERLTAGEMNVELDSTTETKLFLGRFTRYGYNPMKTMTTDIKGGLRFQLPSGVKDMPQTGMYSFFAMAGDFEIIASYEWNNVTAPREGYGVSCGIAVEIDGSPPPGSLRSLTLQRSHLPGKQGEGYLVIKEVMTEDKPSFEREHFHPIRAKKGKLAMRREKDEVIFLVADSAKDELRELHRIAFTEATIRKTRLFAEQGGSMTYVDVKFPSFRARAEEIIGGIPIREQTFAWGWWLTAAGFVVVGTILFVLYRREKRQDEEEESHPAPAKKPAPTKNPAPTSIRPGRPR